MSSFKAGKGGSMPESGKSNSLGSNGIFRKESAGVVYGLSERSDMNVDQSEPNFDYATDPQTGNATERRKPKSSEDYKVSEKGKSFTLE